MTYNFFLRHIHGGSPSGDKGLGRGVTETRLWNRLFPGYVSTLRQLAQAMINATLYGYEKPVLAGRDIRVLAGRE